MPTLQQKEGSHWAQTEWKKTGNHRDFLPIYGPDSASPAKMPSEGPSKYLPFGHIFFRIQNNSEHTGLESEITASKPHEAQLLWSRVNVSDSTRPTQFLNVQKK